MIIVMPGPMTDRTQVSQMINDESIKKRVRIKSMK